MDVNWLEIRCAYQDGEVHCRTAVLGGRNLFVRQGLLKVLLSMSGYDTAKC